MGSLKKGLSRFKLSLTRLGDEEPLSKLSLAIIIILDIFILSIIFGGLKDHTAQLTAPSEYFPYECRRVFIQTHWTDANKIAEVQRLVLNNYNHYSYRYDRTLDKNKIEKMHPVCQDFYKRIKAIADNKALKNMLIQRQASEHEKEQHRIKYREDSEVYNTSLLERIADKSTPELEALSETVKMHSRRIDEIRSEINDIDRLLINNPLIIHLFELIKPGNSVFRQELIDSVNRNDRIYLFKEFAWQLLFLIPLMLIFYFWYAKSGKHNRSIQILISSHLLVVASIPIVMKVGRLVLDLIPKHFFKELFKILKNLHIIAVWHYIVIIISILVALFAIYIVQKKIFNKKRLQQKRLMKGECYRCGKKLPKKDGSCPFCGVNQLNKCSSCNSDTYVAGEYCINCGK